MKFTVKGYGHGVGLSQSGSDSLAKSGSNYEEIIKHFYTNVLHLDENIWDLDNIQEVDITNLDSQNVDNKVVRFITFGLRNS